jgi:NAD(P)-dependent dehydrogenase (short-subunit alcohol dehydrogenase family)
MLPGRRNGAGTLLLFLARRLAIFLFVGVNHLQSLYRQVNRHFHLNPPELGSGLLAIQADVTNVEAIERAVAEAVERFGKLDIVFANAGIVAASPVGQTSLAAFEEIIHTNLTSVFFTVQAAAPHLKQAHRPF